MNFIQTVRDYNHEVCSLLNAGFKVSESAHLTTVDELFADCDSLPSVRKDKPWALSAFNKLLGTELSRLDVWFAAIIPRFKGSSTSNCFVYRLSSNLYLAIEDGGNNISVISTDMFVIE